MAESFIFYETFAKQLDCLDDALQLKFYKAITRYGLYNEEPQFTGLELSVWIPIKTGIDNAKTRRLKSSENGKRGGRPEISQKVQKAVCEDLQAGVPQKEIAEKYTIAQSSVSSIKKEVFDTHDQEPSVNIENPTAYQKPKSIIENLNVNGNVDVNDNDIPPEVSGGEDTVPFSTLNPEDNSESATQLETPYEMPDSIPIVPAGCADTAVPPEPVERVQRVSRSPPHKKKPPLREREPVNDFEMVEKIYLHHWDTLYKAGIVHTLNPVINWQQARKLLQGHFKTIPPDVIAQAVKTAAQDHFILEGGYSLTTILSASVLNRLINAHYKLNEQKQTQYRSSAIITSDVMQKGDYL